MSPIYYILRRHAMPIPATHLPLSSYLLVTTAFLLRHRQRQVLDGIILSENDGGASELARMPASHASIGRTPSPDQHHARAQCTPDARSRKEKPWEDAAPRVDDVVARARAPAGT